MKLKDVEKKTTLWIVTELFPPDETSTAYILGEIANALTQKYCVKVICGPEIYDKHKTIDVNNKFNIDASIEVIRVAGANFDKNKIAGKALSFLLMTQRLYALAKANIQTKDKVLMVTNPAPLILLMSGLKKKRGFDLNILVHDVFPENTKPAGIKLPMYSWVKKFFDKGYSQANHLIVLGRDMADVLSQKVKRYSPQPKISIIENWADVENIEPHPMPKGSRVVLEYAGNIGRVQGLDKVIKQLPNDIELHIYGSGAVEEDLKALKHPRVHFYGSYFRSQQNDVLSACHIAIVTLQEGMYGLGVPSKTYNILASGRPVLYFGPHNSEIDLLVREEHIGYCGWPQKWNMEELIEMGKRARYIAEKRYSKEIILNKFKNVL